MKLLQRGVALALLTTFTLASETALAYEQDKTYKITVLHTNDHHGHFWRNEYGEYGLAAQKTLVDGIRKEVAAEGGSVLLLSGGDINTGVPESDLQDAEPDFRGMNLVGYDAMAIGNHEFDNPLTVLRQQEKWAKFPLLSANIYQKSTGERVLYTPEIAENQQMISLLSPFQNKGKAQLEVKIGETNGRLEGDRDKVRFVQTNMGRLILAAQMDRTGADFAVMSGGGIRDSIEAGDISYKNVLKVQPFGNVVVYADMTGKEVIDYLTAVAQMKPDSGAYPQFANVSFVAKDGKLNDLKIKGEPVDPAKTYRMATLNFNATGGDGYPRLDNKPGYVNTGFIDAEVLKAYIQKSSPLDVSVYEPKGEVSWQ
ncbi:5'-nucleotidase C-terminal domain-containing protein [Escherichia coli]|uniref:5'-nucleotidase C-terminal domain-containing protein n=1 Tax=Escherichia coli TaxID=562 RepID=UPI0033636E20